MEFALVDVALEAFFLELLQDLTNVFLVVTEGLAEYQNIVHIGAHEVI